MDKSALKTAIQEVLDEHEIEDGSLREDLVDRITQDFAGEVYDDEEDGEDEESEPAELG